MSVRLLFTLMILALPLGGSAWSGDTAIARSREISTDKSTSTKPASQQPAHLQGVRVSSREGYTRAILDLDAMVQCRWAAAGSTPPRWYIDLLETAIDPKVKIRELSVNDPIIKGIRFAPNRPNVTRVVFDLHSMSRPRVRVELSPPRLVVEWQAHAATHISTLGTSPSAPPKFPGNRASEFPISAQRIVMARNPLPDPVTGADAEIIGPGPEGESHSPTEPLSGVARVGVPLLHYLLGQRVKIEGKTLQDGKLVAEKIELVENDAEFEIEGPLSRLDQQAGTFFVGSMPILFSEQTKFETKSRQPSTSSDLVDGLRVKVKAKRREIKAVKARTVRLYQESSDTDFEIEAPIESVDPSASELSILSIMVTVTPKTRYIGIAKIEGLPEDTEITRNIRRDDDEQHPEAIRIGNLLLGGKAEFGYRKTRDLDLDKDKPDTDEWLRSRAQIEISAPLGEHSEAYAKVDLTRSAYIGENPNKQGTSDLRLREGFLTLGNLFHPSLSLQIGRQRFRDKREWLYDDRLDAVRLHFKHKRFKVEMSVAQGIFGSGNSRSDQLYFIGYFQYRFPGRRYLSGYIMKRNDTTGRDEDPIWFGLSSRGRVSRKLDYWLELSRMMGRRGKNLLRGYGYDVGASYKLPLPWGATFTAGYAFGSGDRNFSDGVDGNFRQTRLNDNSYRFNGLKRYRYYGVLLEPELYNLRIATADYGIRPSDSWSLNFAYHAYRQDVAYKKLGDTALNIRPSGKDPRLGTEFDVILVFRKIRNIDLSLLMGSFLPGPAFEGSPPRSFLLRPGIQFYF